MKVIAVSVLGVVVGAVMGLVGCDRRDAPAESRSVSPSTSTTAPTAASQASTVADPLSAWAGRWTGPEGTYLQLDAVGNDRYEIRIKDLDAERVFPGIGKDGALHFERDGKTETITATNGDATGMKWLAGKQQCLTVHTGEGYCRD